MVTVRAVPYNKYSIRWKISFSELLLFICAYYTRFGLVCEQRYTWSMEQNNMLFFQFYDIRLYFSMPVCISNYYLFPIILWENKNKELIMVAANSTITLRIIVHRPLVWLHKCVHVRQTFRVMYVTPRNVWAWFFNQVCSSILELS